MTFRQKAQRQTLLTNKARLQYDFMSAFDVFYQFYLKVIDQYESLDDVPYPQREKLICLANMYHRAEEDYKKSIRSLYNFDVIVYDEEKEYQLSAQDLREHTKQSERIYREFMNRKKIHRVQ